jgi:cysteine desulfurase
VLLSGATEANNWIVRATLAARPGGRVLCAPDVHASLGNACARHADRLDWAPLGAGGRLRLADVASRLRPETCLVCCSHAASETGIVHDAAAIAALCARRDVACLIDGAQTVGRIPLDLSVLCADFYVFSAHKFGGPRGIGGVFVRGEAPAPLLEGGAQEGGLRPGTENLPGLAGAVAALECARAALDLAAERLRGWTRMVAASLAGAGVDFLLNGDHLAGLPGFLSVSFPDLDGHALAEDLSLQGFAVATGSACSANRPEPSRAILALGRSPAEALGTLRISFGRTNTDDAVRRFSQALAATVRRHGRQAGAA